jgi:hypothetical protein
MCAHH